MNSAKLLPPICEFIKQSPDIIISIFQVNHENYYSQLDSHSVDVVFGWADERQINGYKMQLLAEDEWGLMINRNNPLAQYDVINLDLAKNEQFILPIDQTSYNRFTTLCQRSGFFPRSVTDTPAMKVLLS